MLQNSVAIAQRCRSRDEIFSDARRVMRGLHTLGVAENDSVAHLMRNDFPVMETNLAVAELGAYAIPFNWHLKPDELAYLLADARPKVLVAHSDLLATIRDSLPHEMHVIAVPTPPETQAHYGVSDRLSELPQRAKIWDTWKAEFTPWDSAAKNPRGSIFYTSGTTGNPKGVRRHPMTPEQSANFHGLQKRLFGVSDHMRAFNACPLAHGTGNSFSRLALREAECFVLQPHFDPEGALATIERERLTHLVMVPTMFVRLSKLPEAVRRRYDVSSVRYVVHTGAPCPPDIKREMINWFGPVISEMYGSTEVGPLTLCTSQDWLSHPGTLGRAMEGATIRVLDSSGRPCQPGEPGEICGRNVAIPDFTYVNLPTARQALDRDGLIATGDIGFLDEDGYLFLADRRDDMVISGGINIYPAEVERVLITMPGVLDCAVFGVPDEDFGESLAAAIVPSAEGSLTAESVRQFLKSKLANYKVPRTVLFDENLPRQETGKISKRKLRARYSR